MNVHLSRVLVLIALASLASCARHEERIIACAASHEWRCPQETVEVEALGAATYRARGCGREAIYACKIATEGCVDRAAHVLDTRGCQ